MGAHVVVYAMAGCQACRVTELALQRAGVEYEVVDLDTNPQARGLVRALEFTSAPVVTTGREWWSGFRPDRIKAITRT